MKDKKKNGKKPANDTVYDVIVVGGGLSGLTLTALLATNGITALCIDRDAPAAQMNQTFDGRTTAISYGSHKVMKAAGVWDDLLAEGCPIDRIDILDGDGPAAVTPTYLTFEKDELPENAPFGWIMENRYIRYCLYHRVQNLDTATHLAPAAVAGFEHHDGPGGGHVAVRLENGEVKRGKLIIGADGRQSFTRDWMEIGTRSWSYEQHAIVCNVIHKNPHNNLAVEHFRSDGPFAILPLHDDENGSHRSSVVWTQHGKKGQKDDALTYSDEVFNAALNTRFPDTYGHVRLAGKRFSFPLALVHAHDYVASGTAPRMALIADAAHGIHPIAGQGLNLGFRDIDVLTEIVLKHRDDPGADDALQEYQRRRRIDNMAMTGATDTLNRLFSNKLSPLAGLRRIGMRAVAKLPPAKRFFMRQAMGTMAGKGRGAS